MNPAADIDKCLTRVTNFRDALLTEFDARIVFAVSMASNASLCAAMRQNGVYSPEVVIKLWAEALITSLTEVVKDCTVVKVPVIPDTPDGKPN